MSFENLNSRQQEAVRQLEGPLLILAGAGSGKTSTMTHRIAHMLEEGISPYSILAVTFTNKAAREMRERVEELAGDRAESMWIMTFHAMCLRILRVYPEEAGYEPNFVIYDGTDQKTLVKNILKENGISDREFAPQYLLAVISDQKEKGVDPEQYRETMENNYKTKAIYLVYREYQKRLRQNNAMDFDDILLNTVKLFERNEEILLRYQERFQYIMVDEYQDTNHIQYRLIRQLADRHRNLCVVGDDDQCIYQWRGADIRNILDFESDFPEAKVIKLEQNYRSKGNILDAAYSVIRNNRGRKSKKLWTDRDSGEKLRYYRANNDHEEAAYVARQIGYMNRAGRPLTDFAILYRTNAQSRLFESALSRDGIPYRVLSGMRYYDRKEIKDIMCYMRLVVNPKDDLSMRRIVNEPKRGMGDKTVEKVMGFAAVKNKSLLEALSDPEVQDTLPGKAYDRVRELTDCLNLCRQERTNLKVSDIYDRLLTKTGYLPALEETGTVESEGRIENLMEFKSVIYDYEKGTENPTIEEFMEQLTLAAEVDNYDEHQDTVTLMTMHSAKGLEFPVVFLPGLEDGLFPGNKAFDDPSGMEEERRLCYVGMTRAKELLFLSSAEERTRYGRTEYTRESQFLRELDRRLVEGDAVYQRKTGDSSLGVSTGSRDGYAAKPYKPFDALKYARYSTRQNAMKNTESFAPGDRVSHGKFGEGMVLEATDTIVTVAFDGAGVKKLALGVAPLKKI
ncbi:ATP-dependent helicase [Hornefia butyriciproducens]|uniref:ATP-dependent helicase n=1 Tax=Hornefia butyriciproducens TaxID=2652293 RepID=UPI0023EF8F91|nr:UvrD-helicase domain-containing protein [Hornefia butyriciproducens]MDD6299242.1 UvrD-helicase domain-containing protein [Hornefia butyriciproducens]